MFRLRTRKQGEQVDESRGRAVLQSGDASSPSEVGVMWSLAIEAEAA
jgi:hypothetical protein